MNSLISGLTIKHHSGGEIEFDSVSNAINVILTDGSLVTYKKSDCGDIFLGDKVAYNEFDRCCIVVSECGSNMIAIYLDQALVKHLCEIERTELFEEGFDYCVFFNFKNWVVLSYELGLIGFDRDGDIAWRHKFPELHVYPQIVNGEILFAENDQEYRYMISDGKII